MVFRCVVIVEERMHMTEAGRPGTWPRATPFCTCQQTRKQGECFIAVLLVFGNRLVDARDQPCINILFQHHCTIGFDRTPWKAGVYRWLYAPCSLTSVRSFWRRFKLFSSSMTPPPLAVRSPVKREALVLAERCASEFLDVSYQTVSVLGALMSNTGLVWSNEERAAVLVAASVEPSSR